jgi:peptidoglycan hydrolase-like protein with peptidoglycan-binding domain
MTARAAPTTVDRESDAEERAMTNVQPLSEGESLAVGAEGDHVQALQEMLHHLGYYQGQVDAQYGEALEEAVKEFQRAVGQQDDGQTGMETWHEILHQVQAASGQDGTAEAGAIAVGQLSEDGAWQWNGSEWVAAGEHAAHEAGDTAAIQVGQLSEDGAWVWDGTEWKAAGEAEPAPEGFNHPALAADPNAEIPKLSQEDFHAAIADTMTVHAGEEA